MDKSNTIIDLTYDRLLIDNERHQAVLFRFGTKEVWLPRALIEIDVDSNVVSLPQWKVEAESLEDYVE